MSQPSNQALNNSKRFIYDNIHGHIPLNRVESRILETLYYQRLRWIKQLGFTFYIYPGATHTRHAHALGVLHVMDRVLKALGKGVSDERLFHPKNHDDESNFHRTMRLAAMLHDIGTFPFSHSIELAYINHWRKKSQHGKVKLAANHETLGKHIIENTDFDGGITRILKEEGIDPKFLSQVIEGASQFPLANQLMHADVDADRMDYLLRDAHHSGIKLGIYDLDLLIRNLTTVTDEKGLDHLAVREQALNVVDAFLVSRFFWYSQIIQDGTGYKFDLIAAKIHEYFLENRLTYSFEELIEKVSQNPGEYFTFNDSYFMAKVHEFLSGRSQHPMIKELSEMLAMRIPPAQVSIAPLLPTLIENEEHRNQLVDKATKAADWLTEEIKAIDPNAWVIFDIPKKDVMFTKSMELLNKDKKTRPLWSRDSIKVLTRRGTPELLIDRSNSLMSILSQYRNFIPRLYLSPTIYAKLEEKKILEKMHTLF
jgi:HD superfamily phosphohydrolase